VPYRLEALPSTPGQYAIDYATGTVYVYGADLTNDGTGPFPPLANYKYRLTYQSEIDYVYDTDLLDLVALPTGSLLDFDGTINFEYEEVFIPGQDYEANLHLEELTERVGNNLIALNAFRTKKGPITNVFRILNETSGEIYTLNRWTEDKVYFRYNTPPRIVAQTGERVSFETIPNELLFVNTSLINSGSIKIFNIPLNNNNIISSSEDGLGSSINTSVSFSNQTIFVSEKWFNRGLSVSLNLENLNNVGEYMIDYTNGIVYCAVSTSQDFNIGTVTYKYKNIIPNFPHIITADDIYYQINPLSNKNKSFTVFSSGENSIIPETLDFSDETFLNNTDSSPYQLFSGQIGSFVGQNFVGGVTNQIKFIRGVYEFFDLQNSAHPFNFSGFAAHDGFNITLNPTVKQTLSSVQYDGTDYFVLINENIPYLSPSINYTFSIIRSSDSQELWDVMGTIVPGNPLKLVLSGLNSPQTNDQVTVNYTIEIKDLLIILIWLMKL
jgi:hypothetical protein